MNNRNLLPGKFFSPAEQSRITQAVRQAEDGADIRILVWLEKTTSRPVIERAAAVFAANALEGNGVLFYLATSERLFAIVKADKIDRAMPAALWEQIRDSLQESFRKDQFAEGLEKALKSVRDELAAKGFKA